MTFSKFYSKRIADIIIDKSSKKGNQIFVILGQAKLIEKPIFTDQTVDDKTFYLNGNETLFDKAWFANIFTKLNSEKLFHLLSYPQFSYLVSYIDSSFFKDRIIILKDNLRQLFPISASEFLEESKEENIEERPENIPVYQAEQIQINDRFFYSVKMPSEEFECVDIFKERAELKESNDTSLETIDVS